MDTIVSRDRLPPQDGIAGRLLRALDLTLSSMFVVTWIVDPRRSVTFLDNSRLDGRLRTFDQFRRAGMGSMTSIAWSRRHLMIDLPRNSKPVHEEREVCRPKRFLKADLYRAAFGQTTKDPSCVFRLTDV